MYRKLNLVFGIIILIVVSATVAILFFHNKPMAERINNPHIVFISVTMGQDGGTYDCDLSESEVSVELNDALISLFCKSEIRRALFSPLETYTVSDDSVYITIKILLDNSDSLSMFVNLCNIPEYNSAHIGDTYYHIVDYEKLYQDVYGLLSDVILAYAVER